MLRLVAPEFNHKAWNYHESFVDFLRKNEIENVLFSYKDQRFGCLSRASAILLYLYDWLKLYLSENPHITNRLACLVRDVFELPYLKVVLVVFASLGIQLIEPFFCRTIQSGATHSSLKIFYKDLYTSMATPITSDFFQFKKPRFSGISEELFEGVKESYSKSCVEAIEVTSQEYEEHATLLANFIIPELRIVLARQRRDYGISDDFPATYPVEDQAPNIDDTPVNNLAMERMLGTADYRLPKLQTLQAVSRSIVLGKTGKLRASSDSTFRSFRNEAEKKAEVTLKWNDSMKEKFAKGLDEKRIVAHQQERKRLDMLEELKLVGGPFTNADEVQAFLDDDSVKNDTRKKRLKLEIQFARDSSTTLPKSDQIFRIMVVLPNKKRRDKNAAEYAESLIAYLGRRSDKKAIEYELFSTSLQTCARL